MSFQPILPMTGYVGWRFLQRTLDSQQQTFNDSAPVKRATDYFREKIGSIRTAEDLVANRRLLEVALGAFGLEDDLDNRFFIQKVLSEGAASSDALASKLSDKRYAAFSEEFGFGEAGLPRTGLASFPEKITALYERHQFEKAVGDQDDDLRSALNVSAALDDIVTSTKSNDARWFSIMGNAPVRAVIQTALGLPSSIAQLDIDLQLDAFKNRADATFGSNEVGNFADPDQQEKLIRLFMIRSESNAFAASNSSSLALTLLQSMPRYY